MGNKKKRQRANSGMQTSANSTEQQKRDNFLGLKKPVSNANRGIRSMRLLNDSDGYEGQNRGVESTSLAESVVRLDNESQNLIDFSSVILEEHKVSDNELQSLQPPSLAVAKLAESVPLMKDCTRENIYDFISKQCFLTEQTVLAIFELLKQIEGKVELIKELFMADTQSQQSKLASQCSTSNTLIQTGARNFRESPGGVSNTSIAGAVRNKSNRILQNNQIAMQIALNRINRGKWNTKRAITVSLSQILRCPYQLIDLLETEWLPNMPGYQRVILTFKQSTIPCMLQKMKPFLASFQIYLKQVFREDKTLPLTDFIQQRSANSSEEEEGVGIQLGNTMALIQDETGGLITIDALEGGLIEVFRALPRLEQDNILQRLAELIHILSAEHERMLLHEST